MQYISTRGQAPALSFTDVLLTGLAPDGGLYLPCVWPKFSESEIINFSNQEYAEVATTVLSSLVGADIAPNDLARMCRTAYAGFDQGMVAPLVQTGPEDWLLELFHGPTLAFKDVAMQLLGQLFEYTLGVRGAQMTVIGATSGDTGAAAIEALRGRDNVDVFILHPEGRVSEVQRRLMTCVPDSNIHNLAIAGSFDDCQALVKGLFAQPDFRAKIRMGAINSINWSRIMAQTVYYFTAVAALSKGHDIGEGVSFCVPTGNFGDIFAGYAAKCMGLPVKMLCIATNQNDILTRVLSTGEYAPEQAVQTISPSMDIQVSSNFERLLFEATGRDAGQICQWMGGLHNTGRFVLPERVRAVLGESFVALSSSEEQTRAMMAKMQAEGNMAVDPHTAVALSVAERLRTRNMVRGPLVTLSTAHPAKFPDAVMAASGIHPVLPTALGDLLKRQEYLTTLPNEIDVVQRYILDHVSVD